MPDPLDPADAFTSAIGGAFLGFVAIFVMVLGGHFMGMALCGVAPAIAALPTSGLPSLSSFDFDIGGVIFSWLGVMLLSFTKWYGWPFLIFDIWLLARLRSGAGFLPTLLAFAIIQPLHTLLVVGRFANALEFIIALGLWIVLAGVTTALVLWWQRVRDEAPPPESEETEPEL